MISDRSVARHVSACNAAMAIIRDRIIASRLTRDATHSAWGQHLDGGRNADQFGVYGTAAGIALLLRAGTPASSPEIALAYASLPFFATDTAPLAAHDENDSSSTFKIAAIVEAIDPGSAANPNDHPATMALLGAVVGDRGWGNWWMSAERHDSVPRIEPTCVALLALHQVQAFKASPLSISVLSWLASEITARDDATPAADALALLVLTEFQIFADQVPGLRPAADACLNRLRSVRRRFPKDTAAHDEYHYEVPVGTGFDSKYVFFPSHAVVALAFLKSPLSRNADRVWAAKVADTVAISVRANRGYRVAGRVGTVDQLWAHRLLSESARIGSTMPRSLVATPVGLLTTPLRRTLVVVVLIAVGGLGGGLTLTTHSLLLNVTGFILGGVSLSGAAGAIWAWTGGEVR